MKKRWLMLINAGIMIGILVFVFIFSHQDQQTNFDKQVESFENLTVAMEKVTENYLQGEQGICDVWAKYINGRDMTLSEATEFIRNSHVLQTTSAHLIYADTREGLSTRRANEQEEGDYRVSYANVDIIGNGEWIADVGQTVNVSRAFTNPMNGQQSLAFINRIRVADEENAGITRDAYLLRIVPVSDLKEKWVFPQQEFGTAELSVINADGDYVIKGNSFKSSNFYEFYKSYNTVGNAALQELKEETGTTSGSFFMEDSRGGTCLIAHTPVSSSNGWIMLGYIRSSSLPSKTENWLLIGVVVVGLLFLLAINTVYLRFVNKRLQQMAEEAESANNAKTVFLSTMSHDIRTPMNAIMGLTAIAAKKTEEGKPVTDELKKISLASGHLLTLINDILDISKVESGRLSLNPLTFSIVETVENLVNISQPMVREKSIEFNFRVDHVEREYLYADQMRLNQIYINVLSNAVKYTPPGGSVNVDLSERPSEKPGCVRLIYTVADNGMGMSPEFMAVMYQPFSRQTDSRVNKIQGTGLGLAITKKMVDLMEGTIECQSETDKGTTFTITLDLPVADRDPDEMRLGPIDVLVVDDDPTLLETAADTLASLGAKVSTAGSGWEALALLEERKKTENKSFDVVILDWKMTEMDGIETARLIRGKISEKIPILLISAYDWSDIETAAVDAGANGFISKPLFRSTLFEKINGLLARDAKPMESEDNYSDLAGMNVLIAGDNDINWEIIHAMLDMVGVGSERAANGRICLETVSAAPAGKYDLIFMDIQMPEMNGLEATRAIRALGDPERAGVPIVAMTADAFSENVAECISAGMDGHVAKPIDIKLVIKEIRKIKEKRK